MVQLSLLETGVAITFAGVMLMSLGRQSQPTTRTIYENEGVSLQPLGQSGITERIFAFSVNEESDLEVRLSNVYGRCSFFITHIPGAVGIPSVEGQRDWHFPKMLEADTLKRTAARVKVYKGDYGLWIRNEQASVANMSFKLSLTENKTRFPRFYSIGTQILVVGIPLVIASFFS
jgi:hypothetical protein